MTTKILNWAKLNIDESENEIRVFISDGNLNIETRTGRCFELSEKEVRYQAFEYLSSELKRLTDEA
jgi:hypothetical protein